MEPVLLMEVISSQNATLTWLPNFAYLVLANKVHPEDITGLNLSSMRMFINCSEPVTKQAHQKFYDFYKNNGLNKNSLGVSYAMAETTFAVTQTLVGKAANVLLLDKIELANGKAIEIGIESEGNGRYCVSSGSTINGCEIKIVSEDGNILHDGFTGEVVIKSLSMFNGYKNNEEKSREVLKDGWYYSGDIGFCKNDEYYIIGRKKDIIIVAGKNLYPEDIEEMIHTCEGVIPGRVVVFGIYNQEIGTDQVHVVVETLLDYVEHKKLSQLIISVAQINEISIACVHIKPSRWLFKSTSGKLSRNDNKNRIMAELNLEI
jgi:acyl-CoA synthetase (AMP-forming)/AMP-acid ligase II